jgi:hypothetical protein
MTISQGGFSSDGSLLSRIPSNSPSAPAAPASCRPVYMKVRVSARSKCHRIITQKACWQARSHGHCLGVGTPLGVDCAARRALGQRWPNRTKVTNDQLVRLDAQLSQTRSNTMRVCASVCACVDQERGKGWVHSMQQPRSLRDDNNFPHLPSTQVLVPNPSNGIALQE